MKNENKKYMAYSTNDTFWITISEKQKPKKIIPLLPPISGRKDVINIAPKNGKRAWKMAEIVVNALNKAKP